MAACDAAVVVYSTQAPLGKNEVEEAQELIATDTTLFTVINRFPNADDPREFEKLKTFAWNRLVHEAGGGPEWTPDKDLATQRIFFVDAKRAMMARNAGNTDGLEASGLPGFERALGRFLTEDRFAAHMEKHTSAASRLSDELDLMIVERIDNAQIDRERARRALDEALPKLKELRRRPDRVAREFEEYEHQAERELTASLSHLVSDIEAEMEAHLNATPLQSGKDKLAPVFHQKKMSEEASAIVSEFVESKVDEWRGWRRRGRRRSAADPRPDRTTADRERRARGRPDRSPPGGDQDGARLGSSRTIERSQPA